MPACSFSVDATILIIKIALAHADYSNHVWMQHTEIWIVACFCKCEVKCLFWTHYRGVKFAICLSIFVRFNEVAKISGVKKPTLQRILPRLEARGWIQSWTGESFDPSEPAAGAVFHLDHKSFVPIEALNEYQSRVQKLKRKVRLLAKDGSLTCPKQEERYAEALERYGKRKKKDMPFRGKAEAWRRAFVSVQPRQYTFYSIIMFPYIREVLYPFGAKILLPYGIGSGSVPLGTKRLWYNSAKEIIAFLESSSNGSKRA